MKSKFKAVESAHRQNQGEHINAVSCCECWDALLGDDR